jgi:spore coat polysaccharide biosynthesis predicted glycosyltransferase SpsG
MKKLFLILLLLISRNGFAQLYESIETEAANIILDLSNHKSLSSKDFEGLKVILKDAVSSNDLEIKYQVNLQEVDSLKTHFQFFLLEFDKISTDSALVLFNKWYLHFSSTFYNYADEKFFSSNKTKILFFSASMSCQCTLEMCRKQTIEILNLAKEKNLDYWIVDSYEHNDLQIKYETFFAPSLIVFDSNNNVLYKIEYDEKMIAQLTNFLNNEYKTQGF